ncbi:glycosyltransferase family 2 protein [Streptococcus suis]
MPVYNRDTVIKEAIDSILCQSDQDFKFLIVDDGSEDKTADSIKSYRDPRIYLIKSDKNLGISTSMNLALSEVKTVFVAVWIWTISLTQIVLQFRLIIWKNTGIV